jgi:hypothetical protein
MIFLQQLECGYGFPALIHVWIASAGVLEWFISTSGEAVAGKTYSRDCPHGKVAFSNSDINKKMGDKNLSNCIIHVYYV